MMLIHVISVWFDRLGSPLLLTLLHMHTVLPSHTLNALIAQFECVLQSAHEPAHSTAHYPHTIPPVSHTRRTLEARDAYTAGSLAYAL
jgi:hypothetical protein